MQKTGQLLGLAAGALAFYAAAPASAATIASYDFTANSLASSDAEANSTASDLSSGGGVPLAFDGVNGQPAPSIGLTMGDINDGTLLDDDYYEFTITPGALTSIDYTSFDIDINKISGGADVQARLYSDIDGFGSEIGNAIVSVQNAWNTYNIDLSGLATQTSATTFRLYLRTTGTFGPNQIKLDNINVTGDVLVVPEPGSLALLALGGLLIARRRRGI